MKWITSLLFVLYIIYKGVQGSGNLSTKPHQCIFIKYDDFTNCHKAPDKQTKGSKRKANPCNQKVKNICYKNFTVLELHIEPYVVGMSMQFKGMLNDCCGHCAKIDKGKKRRLSSAANLSLSTMKDADIVYPVFSRSSTTSLYGFHYIPVIEIPGAYYVTKLKTSEDIINSLMKGFSTLWPLLMFCILFALLAGYIVWILETWGNQDEFPRPFLSGTWEGFWWSFVSMTTVGYGDKTPRSLPASMFSVVWKLIGITIFSMATGSLKNIISDVEAPPSTDMAGKRVGVLKNRVYDATVVARHGGMIHAVEYTNITDGIDTLLDTLFNTNKIDGFLVSRPIYFYYMKLKRNSPHPKSKETFYMEKKIKDEKLSYGLLVKDPKEYHYFQKYMIDNWFTFETCHYINMNSISNKLSSMNVAHSFYSVDNGLFKPFLIGTFVAIGIACFIGIAHEYWRWKKKTGVKNDDDVFQNSKDNPITVTET